MTSYIPHDFTFSRTYEQVRAECKYCGAYNSELFGYRRTDTNQTGTQKAWHAVKHTDNCALVRAANQAAESEQ